MSHLVPCVSACTVCGVRGTSGPVLFCHVHSFPFSLCVRCLTFVFCCDVVELGTYGKLKYYHSMTEEGKPESFHYYLILWVDFFHPSWFSSILIMKRHPSLFLSFACDTRFAQSCFSVQKTSLRFHISANHGNHAVFSFFPFLFFSFFLVFWLIVSLFLCGKRAHT